MFLSGLIYGAAIGDAIGVACRWMSADECAFHYGNDEEFMYDKIVRDEHRVLWRQGSWTSNFDQLVRTHISLSEQFHKFGWGCVFTTSCHREA